MARISGFISRLTKVIANMRAIIRGLISTLVTTHEPSSRCYITRFWSRLSFFACLTLPTPDTPSRSLLTKPKIRTLQKNRDRNPINPPT